MITVLFFAQTRELIGEDKLMLPATYQTVEALREDLSKKGNKWDLALAPERLLTAVNQQIVSLQHPLASGDEVAFFPPVTGG